MPSSNRGIPAELRLGSTRILAADHQGSIHRCGLIGDCVSKHLFGLAGKCRDIARAIDWGVFLIIIDLAKTLY